MSTQWTVAQCDECGGAVAFDPTHALVKCLFCAAVALRPMPAEAPPQPPRAVVPFVIDADAAQAAFAKWIRRSWWRPKALHDAQASLTALWIPAWQIRADVELHWAALIPATTRSGKRPRTGLDRGHAHVLVPASGGVTVGELNALRPFTDATRPWVDADAELPLELPSLSEAGAVTSGHDLMIADRLRVVSRTKGLIDAGGTARLHDVETSLDALPLWIGSFRYREQPWRVVVNGFTGSVVGKAPIDRVKVAIAIMLFVIVALLIARCERREPELEPEPGQAAQSGSSASQGTTVSTNRPG